MNILQLIASLSILVFIHELGHFAMARLFGARVEKFYLFFNPWFSLFKYKSKRSGTIYGLGWLPLGGYCQIAGMVDESMDSEGLKSAPKPDEFRSKKAWQRLLIMAGGIIFNVILAMIIYIGIAFTWGDKHLDSKSVESGWKFSEVAQQVGFRDGDIILEADGVGHLNALSTQFTSKLINAKEIKVLRDHKDTITIAMPNDFVERMLAAEQSFATPRVPFIVDSVVRDETLATGLHKGDNIIAINGQPTPDIEAVISALQAAKGTTVEIMAIPVGQVKLGTKAFDTESDSRAVCYQVAVDTVGQIGVVIRPMQELYLVEQISYGVFEAVPAGIRRATTTIGGYVSSLRYVFTKEGAKSMGGLGTMAKLFPSGFDWLAFWSVTAFLSIILAVMNLLPIPALDGGHIVFILLEMITRRKLSDKVMMYIQTVGMVLLILLMLYANGNDIYRYLIK